MTPPLLITVGGAACPVKNQTGATEVWCFLPAGTGLDVLVSVSSGGRYSQLTYLVSYAAPSLAALLGPLPCRQFAVNEPLRLVGCPRAGFTLTLVGANFGGAGASVFVGSTFCANVTHVSHSLLKCEVAMGAGRDLSVFVLQSKGAVYAGEASVLISHARPYYSPFRIRPYHTISYHIYTRCMSHALGLLRAVPSGPEAGKQPVLCCLSSRAVVTVPGRGCL
jgi:hypothetical protein